MLHYHVNAFAHPAGNKYPGHLLQDVSSTTWNWVSRQCMRTQIPLKLTLEPPRRAQRLNIATHVFDGAFNDHPQNTYTNTCFSTATMLNKPLKLFQMELARHRSSPNKNSGRQNTSVINKVCFILVTNRFHPQSHQKHVQIDNDNLHVLFHWSGMWHRSNSANYTNTWKTNREA